MSENQTQTIPKDQTQTTPDGNQTQTTPENRTQNIPPYRDVFHATKRNDLAAVKWFIEERDNPVTVTDSDQKSIALVAAEFGRLPILKYILKKNSTLVSCPDKAHHTVLERAIQRGDLESVEYLVEDLKVDILAPDHHINTAVHVAAQEGQLAILKYFIEEKKADVNVKNENSETPLFSAAEKPYIYVVMYLIEECHADPTVTDLTKDNILFKSAKYGDVTVPKYLLDVKKIPFEVNWRNTAGYTAINWACKFNQTEFVKYMVENKKADVSIPDTKKGRTPLHHAAVKNNLDLCKFLIEHGANAETPDNFGSAAIELVSEPRVASYLNSSRISSTTKGTGNRKRRSAKDTIIFSNSQFQPRPTKKVMGSLHRSKDRLEGESRTNDLAVESSPSMSAFNSFLAIFDTVMRHSRNYVQMPSPSELLRQRIDNVALSATNQPRGYGEKYPRKSSRSFP